MYVGDHIELFIFIKLYEYVKEIAHTYINTYVIIITDRLSRLAYILYVFSFNHFFLLLNMKDFKVFVTSFSHFYCKDLLDQKLFKTVCCTITFLLYTSTVCINKLIITLKQYKYKFVKCPSYIYKCYMSY